ncbi:MAG: DUF6624 domain-containing protein [Bacteroidota bacterium]
MRCLLLLTVALVVTSTPASAQQTLDGPVRERLRIEVREMLAADKRVRAMAKYGTFSPCKADEMLAALDTLTIEGYLAESQRLEAEAAERLSDAEKAVLLERQWATDEANIARLREIVEVHGWPDSTRIGGQSNPFIILMHTPPDTLDAMLPALRAEVDAGHMPATQYARAVDKQRKINGQLQLYGTGPEFDPETRSVQPPKIASIEETNAARAEIGLPPLEEYRLASGD